jgi:hypothetical protein
MKHKIGNLPIKECLLFALALQLECIQFRLCRFDFRLSCLTKSLDRLEPRKDILNQCKRKGERAAMKRKLRRWGGSMPPCNPLFRFQELPHR